MSPMSPPWKEMGTLSGRVASQVAAGDDVLPQVGMTDIGGVPTVGAIPEVADHRFPEHRDRGLQGKRGHAFQDAFAGTGNRFHDGVEELFDGVSLGASHAVDEPVAGRHVKADTPDACAILTAIVLLFHQQEKPPQTP